jgi:hypothetical protein
VANSSTDGCFVPREGEHQDRRVAEGEMTWEELKKLESGTILHDAFDEGIRFIVMRGPSSLCAYVGIPLEHPLAGHSYDDLPVEAHGGLTYAGKGDKWRPEGFYWYGWDYSHAGDWSFYQDKLPVSLTIGTDKKWLVEDVIKDSWEAIWDFKKLVKLAKQIKGTKAEGREDGNRS